MGDLHLLLEWFAPASSTYRLLSPAPAPLLGDTKNRSINSCWLWGAQLRGKPLRCDLLHNRNVREI